MPLKSYGTDFKAWFVPLPYAAGAFLFGFNVPRLAYNLLRDSVFHYQRECGDRLLLSHRSPGRYSSFPRLNRTALLRSWALLHGK